MLIAQIEILREQLHDMINSSESDYSEILSLSQELDVLIVAYLKESSCGNDRVIA